MKIELTVFKENEDGSADCTLELDEAGKNSIYRILDKSVWLVVGIAVAFFFDILKK